MGIVPPGFCLLPFPFTLIHSENNQKGGDRKPPRQGLQRRLLDPPRVAVGD